MSRLSTCRSTLVFCALVLLALVLLSPANAGIKQASLDKRPVALMEKFRTLEPAYPASLASDKDVFVVVYAASASSDFYVLARPSVDPIQLARILESSVRGTPLASEPVMYMSDREYSWADAYISRSRLGSQASAMWHPVGLVMSRLQAAGLKPHVLLYVLNSASLSHRVHLKGYRGRKGFAAYVPANRTDLEFTLRSRLSSGDLVRVSLLLFVIPVVGLVAIPVLIYVARVRRTTPGGRRSLLTGWLFWLMTLGTLFELSVFRSQFQSPWRYRLQDLWFGEVGAAPMLMIPLMAGWVLILIGYLVGRAVFRGDAPESRRFSSLRRRNIISFVAVMAFFLAIGRLTPHLPSTSLLARSPSSLVIFVILVLPGMYARIMRNWVRMPGRRTPDDELHQRLADLASRSGIELRGVDLVDMPAPRNRLMDVLYRRDGTLLIPRELAERLSPGEMDFMAAREFATAASGNRTKAVATAWASAILVLIPGILLVTQPLDLSLLNWTLWCVVAGLALLAIDANVFDKRRDVEADRRALTLTGGPKIAVEALRKAAGALDTSDVVDPKSLQLRVQTAMQLRTLKKAAERMGPDSDAGLQETEQDDALTARAQAIASQLGVRLSKVEIIMPLTGERLVNAAALRGGRIVVGRALRETFSPEETDWVLAHELAHLKRRHVAKMLALMITSIICVIASVVLTTSGHLANFQFGYLIPMLGLGLMMANATWLSRRRELEADRMALRITRDLPTALSALEKLAQNIKVQIPEEMEGYMTHPKNAYRVRSLVREAKRLGLPEIDTQIARSSSEDQVADMH